MGKSGKFFQSIGLSFLFKVILVLGLSLDLFAQADILEAYWQTNSDGTNTFIEGNIAKLAVKVQDIPEGTQIKFDIYEDDAISNDYIATVYAKIKKYTDGNYYAVASWKTVWVNDGIGQPEYIFKASYNDLEKTSNSKIFISVMPSFILKYIKETKRLEIALYDKNSYTLLDNKKLQVTINGKIYDITTGKAGSLWEGFKDIFSGVGQYRTPGIAFIDNIDLELPVEVKIKVVDDSLAKIEKIVSLKKRYRISNFNKIKLKIDNEIYNISDIKYTSNDKLSFNLNNGCINDDYLDNITAVLSILTRNGTTLNTPDEINYMMDLKAIQIIQNATKDAALTGTIAGSIVGTIAGSGVYIGTEKSMQILNIIKKTLDVVGRADVVSTAGGFIKDDYSYIKYITLAYTFLGESKQYSKLAKEKLQIINTNIQNAKTIDINIIKDYYNYNSLAIEYDNIGYLLMSKLEDLKEDNFKRWSIYGTFAENAIPFGSTLIGNFFTVDTWNDASNTYKDLIDKKTPQEFNITINKDYNNYKKIDKVVSNFTKCDLDPTITNHRPKASFTLDKSSANIGDTITATSNSTDEDGDTLTYTWHLFKPDGSSATLSYSSDKSKAYFTADKEGSYTLALNVSDGELYHNVFKKIIVNKAYTATDLIIEKKDDKNHIYLENINVDPCDFKQIAKITIPNNEKWKYLKLVGSKENIAIITKWNQKPTPQDSDWRDKCHNGYYIWKRFNGQVYDFHESTKIYTTNISSHNAGDILYIYAYSPDTQEGGGVSNYSLNSIVGIDQDQDGDGVPDNKDAFKNDPNEQYDSDHDGIGDNADAFSNDPAASADSDGDGCPDKWNDGYTQADSTTGLKIDMFPKDKDRCEEENTGGIDLLKGLVAHYEFEGDAKDSSGNGNDGTQHGGVEYVDGVIGKAAKFDGVDDYIEVLDDNSLDVKKLSISAWINTSELQQFVSNIAGGIIVNKENAYELALDYQDNHIKFSLDNTVPDWGWIYAAKKVSFNQWNYITETYNGNEVKIYINGILIFTKIAKGDITNTEYPLGIGARYCTCTGVNKRWKANFKGLIDDVRIYNRALNEDEIKALYKLGQHKVELDKGLVAHYEFEGDANDSSGNGNDMQTHNVNFINGIAYTNGTDSTIKLSSFHPSGNEISFFALVKFNSFKDINPIVDHHAGFNIWYKNNDKKITFYVGNSSPTELQADFTMETDKWYSVVATFDGKTKKLYVNGQLIGQQQSTGSLPDSDYPFFVMSDETAVYRYSDGAINSFRIYNRALNEQEVKALCKLEQPKIDLNNGLVAHYEFEGDAKDSSGNGNDGTQHGGVEYVDGVIGKAAKFDGVDDEIDFNILKPQNDFSISFWIKPESLIYFDHGILDDGRSGEGHSTDPWIWILIEGDHKDIKQYSKKGSLCWNWEDVNAGNHPVLCTKDSLSTNKFTHITLVREGNYKKIFINGIFNSKQFDDSTPNYYNQHPFTLGNLPEHPDYKRHFIGAIDDLRFYNRALNNDEIKALYKLGQPKVELDKGLVAHYEFEGDAKDSSGNENDGTQHGGVKYVDGVIGKAAKFDGVDDIILANDPLDGYLSNQPFTVSTWIKTSTTDDADGIISQYSSCLNLNDNERFFLVIYNINDKKIKGWTPNYSTGLNRSMVVDNTWHLVTLVSNLTSITIYVDGNLQAFNNISNDNATKFTTNGAPLAIGGFYRDGCPINHKYKGLIDDVRIYNRALNEQEIKALYKEGNLSSAKKTISIQKGWNLIALPESFSLDNDDMQLLWTNDGSSAFGGWRVYSSVQNLKNLIASKNIPLINAINSNRGYWYFSNRDKNISIEDKNVTFNSTILKSGWNLVGTNANISIKDIKCPDSYQAVSLWKFKNANWLLHTDIQNSLGLNDFDTIFTNEGFWVYCQKLQPEQITCSEDEKEVNGVCIKKTCKDDGYACPTCDTQSEVLKYNSDGSGYCEALPKRSLYTGKWTGTSYLYLVNDPSAYCKWSYDVTINSDGTGSATGTLTEHNKDQGYCISGYGTFAITYEDSHGFAGKVTSSSAAIFGNTYTFNLTFKNNKLSSTNSINIEGYPAKREITLTRQ